MSTVHEILFTSMHVQVPGVQVRIGTIRVEFDHTAEAMFDELFKGVPMDKVAGTMVHRFLGPHFNPLLQRQFDRPESTETTETSITEEQG